MTTYLKCPNPQTTAVKVPGHDQLDVDPETGLFKTDSAAVVEILTGKQHGYTTVAAEEVGKAEAPADTDEDEDDDKKSTETDDNSDDDDSSKADDDTNEDGNDESDDEDDDDADKSDEPDFEKMTKEELATWLDENGYEKPKNMKKVTQPELVEQCQDAYAELNEETSEDE